jgi:hypothetical protein
MRKLITAAMAAVVLLAGAPATAQVIASVEQGRGRAANSNLRYATEGAQRAMALADEARPDISGARSPADVLAAVEAAAPAIEQARIELGQIARGIRALPAVAGSDDAAELHATEALQDGMADLVERTDRSLAIYLELVLAIRAEDFARAQDLVQQGKEGIPLGYDARALMFRSSAAFVGSDRSEYAQMILMACVNDGFAAYARAALDLMEPAGAAENIEKAAQCVRLNLRATQSAMAREAAASRTAPADIRDMQSRMAAISQEALQESEALVPLLEQARSDVAAGQAMAEITRNFGGINEVLARLRALGAQQLAVNDGGGH